MKALYTPIALLARAMGLSIGKLPPPYDRLEAHLKALLANRGINCALDVGAHHGEYGRMLRGLGFAGRIVSFEPVSENYRVLERAALADKAWFTRHVALGATDGVADMHVARGTVCSSFLEPSEYGREQLGSKLAERAKENVEVKRLDDLFPECVRGIEDPHVHLKSDAQGFDLDVLEGARHILGRVAVLQVEISVRPIYRNAPDFLDVIPRLRELGFELSGLFPVAIDRNMRLMELDAVLVA